MPTQINWPLLVKRIHAGQCVPFLGAAVNVSTTEYAGLPLGRQVALHLLAELIATRTQDVVPARLEQFEELAEVRILNAALETFPDLFRLEMHDLARVALYLEQETDNPNLLDVLRRVLPDRMREPSAVLRTLAPLPFKVIVTTNYDRLMEAALDEIDRPYRPVVQPLAGFDPLEIAELNLELAECKAKGKLILYKIHGSFTDDHPQQDGGDDRVLITEEDYIEFLTVVADDKVGIPEAIASELSTTTLLFLGYSLEDWDFRTLYKGTIERLHRHKSYQSYAIQKDPSDFWVRFWESGDKNVTICDIDMHGFVQDLQRKYKAYVRHQVEAPP